jgi:hypothetical protein
MIGWILPALLVATPLALMAGAAGLASLRAKEARGRFFQRHRQQVYLLWDTRGGWHPFMTHNVLPTLPPEVLPCPRGARRLGQSPGLGVWGALGAFQGGSLPALVVFRDDELRAVSLCALLAPLAREHRRSPPVQARVRALLLPVLETLKARAELSAGGQRTSAAAPLTYAGGG